MVNSHVDEGVTMLRDRLHESEQGGVLLRRRQLIEGYRAALELIEQEWDPPSDIDERVWREGYEQCMADICDAIADAWGLPTYGIQESAS